MTGFGKRCRTAQLTYHKSKILHAQQILHWTGRNSERLFLFGVDCQQSKWSLSHGKCPRCEAKHSVSVGDIYLDKYSRTVLI